MAFLPAAVRRSQRKAWVGVLSVVLAAAASSAWTVSGGDPATGAAVVSDAIDGDTIVVGRGWRAVTVRLIGVDTPETVHPNRSVEPFGPEASAFTRRSLLGERVRLEFDAEPTDRFGRMLAYVVRADGTMFNEELVRNGYGRAYTRFPFRHSTRFRAAEAEARRARRGLWSAAPERPVVGNRRSRVYRLPGDPGYDVVKETNRVEFASEDEALRAGYRRAKQ